jgi:FKBP-type peptidyl-prolyl cis-trans isomerase FklB
MRKHIIFTLAAACLLAAGCAQKNTTTTGSVAQEYLSLWMQEYHPGISATSTGVYILEDEPGTGDVWDKDKLYSMLIISIRTLDGTYSSAGHMEIAKQLGTYSNSNYYGPAITYTSSGYAGLEAILTGMRAGGSRTAVVPSWLLTTNRYNTIKEYLDACSSTTHLIYSVSFDGQTDDVDDWEEDTVREYALENYGSDMRPASFNDVTKEAEIFYFMSDAASYAGADTLETGAKVLLNYTGRLLNGQVFDTTIEKVAKDNGIYDKTRTYGPVTITTASSYENYALNGSTSLVDGFKGALSKMKYVGEKAVTVFTSELGYDYSGSGSGIPPYAPLRFDLEYVSLSN